MSIDVEFRVLLKYFTFFERFGHLPTNSIIEPTKSERLGDLDGFGNKTTESGRATLDHTFISTIEQLACLWNALDVSIDFRAGPKPDDAGSESAKPGGENQFGAVSTGR
jgi:hypothetical protein